MHHPRAAHYQNVCIEAISYTLPDEVVTSAEIEARLADLYRRLRLPAGRLELFTGIRERRFWRTGTLPSEKSAQSAQQALRAARWDRHAIGAVVHASVCRDYLEPATACSVHRQLDLAPDCLIYDVSNACLGFLNAMVQVANMIELGQITAGLVVGTESGRQLVDTTIAQLNGDPSLTRDDIKLAVASLTIGSGSAAALLVHRELSRTGNGLRLAVFASNTTQSHLCRGTRDEGVAGAMRPTMRTDAETLMREGIAVGQEGFARLLHELGVTVDGIDKTFCHQVGTFHRQRLLEALAIDPAIDFATVEWLGNTGSVALPMTAAIGCEQGHVTPGDQVALMGIGSGINVLLLAVDWQHVPTAAVEDSESLTAAGHSRRAR